VGAARSTCFPASASASLGGAATVVAARVPFGSAPVFAIVLGVLVASVIGVKPVLRPGISASGSVLLRGAVVVLGAELPLVTVLSQGVRSLPAIVITLGGCLIGGARIGRRLGIVGPLRTLVTVGTGICGASANRRGHAGDRGRRARRRLRGRDNLPLQHPRRPHLSPARACPGDEPALLRGLLRNRAVNDLSSVVAAGNAYGSTALQIGVVVKLTRTLMIVPICAVLAARHERAAGTGKKAPADDQGGRPLVHALTYVPGFLVAFLALASTVIIPAGLTPTIGNVATWMITVALTAVGLSIDLTELRRTGPRPIVLGASLWMIVTVLSLTTQLLGIAG
jgi:uncharacterized membrane protein YadS